MSAWLLPTFGYLIGVGFMGVIAKLALRTIEWQQLVLWVAIAYAFFALGFALFGGVRLPLGAGGGWAALMAFIAAGSLILLFVALSKGEASRVVPIAASYPALTLLASAFILSERITPLRVAGTLLVIGGVVLLSR